MTTSTTILHQQFCLPRPGEDEPRIESYQAERTGPDGLTVTARPTITRCLECGSMTIDGTPTP